MTCDYVHLNLDVLLLLIQITVVVRDTVAILHATVLRYCRLTVVLGLSPSSSETQTYTYLQLYTLAPPPLPGDASLSLPVARADRPSIDTDLSQSSAAGSAAQAHGGLRRSCPWPPRPSDTAACIAVDTATGTRRAWARSVMSPLEDGRPLGCTHSSGCWLVAISSLDPGRPGTAHFPDRRRRE